MGQYSKLLTKNTPPPNIRNINIMIIPCMKGGIITLNKNEFLVYNFFAWTVVVSLMYNYLCLFVRHFLVASFVMMLSLVIVVSYSIYSYPVFCQINLFLALSEKNYFKKFIHLKIEKRNILTKNKLFKKFCLNFKKSNLIQINFLSKKMFG